MIEMNLNVRKKESNGDVFFIEELTSDQFASYGEVTELAGVIQGTAMNPTERWLRFNYDGVELIISRKRVRDSVSWDHLHSVGCVFGTKVITVNGNQYKVRLLKGAESDPPINGEGQYLEGTHNSEWSRLFYPIVINDTKLNSVGYDGYKDPRYTVSNLDIGSGNWAWCQETLRAGHASKIVRGGIDVTYISSRGSNKGSFWRPCLELIP